MRNGDGFQIFFSKNYFDNKWISWVRDVTSYLQQLPPFFGTEVYAASGKVFRRIWLDTSISHLFVFISPDIWHLVPKMDFITADARM